MTDQHVSIYLFFSVSKNTLILLKSFSKFLWHAIFILYNHTYKVQYL